MADHQSYKYSKTKDRESNIFEQERRQTIRIISFVSFASRQHTELCEINIIKCTTVACNRNTLRHNAIVSNTNSSKAL